MGKMRERLGERGKNKFKFDTQDELNIYKNLIGEKVSNKVINDLTSRGASFVDYCKWESYVVNAHKNKSKNDIKNFSKYLEQRIRNEQISNKFISLVIPILLTALLTTVLGEILNICDIDFSGQPLWVIILALFAILVVVFFVALFFKDSFNDIVSYQIRESFFIDYKKIIDEMLQKKCCVDGDSKCITETDEFENSLTVEDGKIELRNISADVDIEMPNMSIHIKQK